MSFFIKDTEIKIGFLFAASVAALLCFDVGPQVQLSVLSGILHEGGHVFALLLLGLLVAPKICKVITIPKNIMIPVVTSLCVIGSFACNNRLFDVGLMFFFGLMGFMMRRFDYPVAPLILAMVLGKMMDSNFRQAVSLASSSDNPFMAMFGHTITIVLSICTLFVLLGNIPWTKPYIDKVKGIFSRKTA